MIRITKQASPPAILRNRGKAATQSLCAIYEADEAVYLTGAKHFASDEFAKEIYGAASVKTALRSAQHDKCAFCESKVPHIGYGDVEHFRPKAGVKQQESDTLQRPGYFWLAYEWSNLFFCCQLCNQRFKRNLFPLRDATRRARSHRDSIDAEEPLLIDPSRTDPQPHLIWRAEYPQAAPDSLSGQVTIAILGLDREELAGKRRDRLLTLRRLRGARDALRQFQQAGQLSRDQQEELDRLESYLEASTRDDAEYAAMARAFFAGS